MANEVVLKHSDSEIATAFESNERAALQMIVDNVSGIAKAEDLFKLIGKSAMIGRAQWVQTAVITAKAFENKSRKEMSATREQWASTLRYSVQQISNFRQAGEKLIKGDFESIPNTMSEFLARPSAKKPEYATVKIVRAAGAYIDGDGVERVIFFAVMSEDEDKKGDDAKLSHTYVTVSSEQAAKVKPNDCLTVQPMDRLLKSGKTVKENHYFNGDVEITSFKVVAL